MASRVASSSASSTASNGKDAPSDVHHTDDHYEGHMSGAALSESEARLRAASGDSDELVDDFLEDDEDVWALSGAARSGQSENAAASLSLSDVHCDLQRLFSKHDASSAVGAWTAGGTTTLAELRQWSELASALQEKERGLTERAQVLDQVLQVMRHMESLVFSGQPSQPEQKASATAAATDTSDSHPAQTDDNDEEAVPEINLQ
jgi:hypothetical protein